MPELRDLRVSDHVVRKRWFQRSSDVTMHPVDAWHEGVPIYGSGLDGDEVRYHAHTETVLVRKNDTLVTVIDEPTAKRSVRMAVHHFGGGTA